MGTALKYALLWLAVATVLFPLGVCGFSIAAQVAARTRRQPVTGDARAAFPILVLTPTDGGLHEANIVKYGDLAEFLQAHPEHAFLIPEAEAPELKRQVVQSVEAEAGTHELTPSVDIEALADGGQQIDLNLTVFDDQDSEYWYSATATRVEPEFRQSASSLGVSIGAAFLAVPFAGVLAVLGASAIVFWRVRRRRRAPSA